LTEVPDHLLQRSRDRRAALGLGGDDSGGDAAPAASAPSATPATTGGAAPARPAAAAPVPAAPKPPAFIPPYVRASERRQRIPVWCLPVVAFLPIWGVLYAQSLSESPSKEPSQLAAGATVYGSKCSTCHGGSGGGGAGRQLSDGMVLLTFPNIANQLEYVHNGDDGMGKVAYGNPERPGGQHAPPYNGGFMPTFKTLSEKELLEVVRHERETISGEKDTFKVDATGARLWPNGKPMLNSSGKLVWDDGELMFDEDGKLSKPVDPAKPPS
jgi:mono/diheme cytochrome c family protein